MIRETLAPTSKHAYMIVTPSNRARFHGRVNSGGTSFGLPAPAASVNSTGWVKLERVGNTFNAYWSSDGVNWVSAGTQAITMGTNVLIGLAATAPTTNPTEVNASTFDNVTITAAPPPPTGIDLTGTAANDNWTLRRVGDQIQVFNNADGGGTAVSSHVLGTVFTLSGGDGDDTVNLDMSG